jgi:hypothetical protein
MVARRDEDKAGVDNEEATSLYGCCAHLVDEDGFDGASKVLFHQLASPHIRLPVVPHEHEAALRVTERVLVEVLKLRKSLFKRQESKRTEGQESKRARKQESCRTRGQSSRRANVMYSAWSVVCAATFFIAIGW